MSRIDFDRAFPKTPVCIHSAIEMGIRKGKKKMKMHNKIISLAGVAAGLIIVIAMAALAAGGFDAAPKPDVLAQPVATDTPVLTEEPTVYCTEKGRYFHYEEHCSGMEGASARTLSRALEMGKGACPICVPYGTSADGTPAPALQSAQEDETAVPMVYCTAGGSYYHAYSDCSGMRGASRVPLEEVWQQEKEPCPMCISPINVFCTVEGSYYHSDRHCSGLENATAMSAEEAQWWNKQPCPVCIEERVVYYAVNGKYYHNQDSCMDDTYDHFGKLLYAISAGMQACPECMGQEVTEQDENQDAFWAELKETQASASPTTAPQPFSAAESPLYLTQNGIYAHYTSDCCGISGAQAYTYAQARQFNRISCPVCGPNPQETVYATKNGKYYHCVEDCSGMLRALATTPVKAQWEGKWACPVCIVPAVYDVEMNGEIPNQDWLQRFMPDTNNGLVLNDYVYTAVGEDTFHHIAYCPYAPEESDTLELALARNQHPCPKCIGSHPKDNDLFETAFGQFTDKLWENWRYSHSRIQDLKNGIQEWIFTNGNGSTSPACTVYDLRGTGSSGEYQLDVYFLGARDSRRFLENVTIEPMKSMYPLAMEMSEDYLRKTNRPAEIEYNHVSDLVLLFDEDRQLTHCIMHFLQPDAPYAVSLEVTENGIEAHVEDIQL